MWGEGEGEGPFCLKRQKTEDKSSLDSIDVCFIYVYRVCEGVTGAFRFANLSREDFVRNHAYSAKPIVVEGAALGWSAMDVFSYEYFKDLYLRIPGSLDDDNIKGQFFSYSSNIMDLKDLFRQPTKHAEMKTERWYIGW